MKITAKFRASRRLRFEDTKRIVSPEIRPKSFGTFEKQAPGADEYGDATPLYSCHGVFIDRFIFRSNCPGIRIPWESLDRNCFFFSQKKKDTRN